MDQFPLTGRFMTGARSLFVVASLATVVGGGALSHSASAASCASPSGQASPSAAASSGPASTPELIPTQAAIEPEQNPPGDIPDNQAFVTYTSTEGGYSFQVPEGWARQENGPNVVFSDKLHRFSVDVACSTTEPTVESVTANDVPVLQQQVPAFELVEVKALDLPAGKAVLVRYQANSAPDEVTGKQIRLEVDRYEFFKDGAVAALSLAAPAGSDNVDVSNQVSRSFQWTA